MKLKYQTEISKFDCNLSLFKEQERQAFRWVFSDILDARNFQPVYLDPIRPQINCRGYALSFFEKQESARSRLHYMAKDKEKLYKKLGTHIANGKLEKTDGISDMANQDGHFSHFEYENINLNTRFEILEKVATI